MIVLANVVKALQRGYVLVLAVSLTDKEESWQCFLCNGNSMCKRRTVGTGMSCLEAVCCSELFEPQA